MAVRDVRTALMLRLRRTSEGERGSLPMLMLVMIATTALGAIMLSMMLTASHQSEFVQTRVLALNAAQSGIDSVVGQLRAADSTTDVTVGDSGRLPCGPFTSGTGSSSSNSGALAPASDGTSTSYTVKIAYYDVDPSTLGTNDLTKTTNNNGQQMLCTSNGGPYNTTTAIRTPKYALITSTGTYSGSTTEKRTVQTTYNFQVLNQNISGGQIRLYPGSTTQANQWCMDAGSSPAAGVTVTIQPCSGSNPPIAQQVWAYRSDLSIELVSSVTNPNSAGLCLDTNPNSSSHAAGDAIKLQQCAVADSSVCPAGSTPASYHTDNPSKTCSVSPWNQQWSVDDSARLQGAQNATPSDLDGLCITAGSQGPGVGLNLQNCTGGTTDPTQTWIPSPTTGAGMASAGNQQLVNFQQFATCLDVTGKQVSTPYLILYTCKQNPDPTKVAFNQKFIPSAPLGGCPSKNSDPTNCAPQTVLITVVTSGNTYCLKSPLVAGGYPTLVQQGTGGGQCPSSVSTGSTSPFAWVMNRKYADAAGTVELSYANKYTIVDSKGLCLGPGNNNDLLNNAYYKAVVTGCTGDNSQKWNAAAFTSQANLTNTTELSGTSGG